MKRRTRISPKWFDQYTIAHYWMQLMPGGSWARGYMLVQNRPNTVLFAMSRTKAREDLFKWACPINTNRHVLIAKTSQIHSFNSLADAGKLRIGVVRDDASGQLLLKQIGRATVVEAVSSFEQNIKKLNAGRIDLAAYGETTAWSVIAKMGHSPEDYQVVYVLSEEQACFAFHRDTPDQLVRRFQQSLDKITASPVYLELIDRYFLGPPETD